MSNLNVPLNANYRLTSDGTQFIVKERKLVDPTKAPGYRAEEGAPAPEITERWDNAGYYSLSAAGLTAALNRAIIASAATSGHESLTDFIAEILSETKRMADAVSDSLSADLVAILA
ncbi:hypothetical protein [Paenibacillus sp. SN-8-1]|uniref:hypothetical protein n=1 Tax=Paenibacillus sp. SN-8-1 TaxID=3435409 RepID=UPI003D9A9C6B